MVGDEGFGSWSKHKHHLQDIHINFSVFNKLLVAIAYPLECVAVFLLVPMIALAFATRMFTITFSILAME